jgi:hypothetical protein
MENMSEAVTFWLDNKISSGIKVAEVGRQALVAYREKFYVVEGGAAHMKGSKPLHYSKTSLPTIWKKALRGISTPPDDPTDHQEQEILPATIMNKKERAKMTLSTSPTSVPQEQTPACEKNLPTPPRHLPPLKKPVATKPPASTQTVIPANCPYCNSKHELPLEKGKNGRAFFVACSKCAMEFAVRFVPVTIFQAQVAAFK